MDVEKTNRPNDKALFQQKLTAWKPLMTFLDAAFFFVITGLIVLIVGIFIYLADRDVSQFSIDYTDCNATAGYTTNITCSNITNLYINSCSCSLNFYLNSTIPPPVYFYYGLNNFYQNYRQLINSYDINQLMGKPTIPASACSPVLKDNVSNYYAPCGQMANVMFNDTFDLKWKQDLFDSVPWTKDKIALNSDMLRYTNPANWNGTTKPPNWKYSLNASYGYADNLDLMVWMRPAFLPSFRKLYRILQTTKSYAYGLPLGNYTLNIQYNYPVKIFSGQKLFIISTTSWIGGKNMAMGILYFITGIIEILIAIILFVMHAKHPTNKVNEGIVIVPKE